MWGGCCRTSPRFLTSGVFPKTVVIIVIMILVPAGWQPSLDPVDDRHALELWAALRAYAVAIGQLEADEGM